MAAQHILVFFGTAVIIVMAADHCTFNKKVYTINQQFNPTPCQVCICSQFGSVACSTINCPPLQCVDSVHKQGECCADCPNGANCKHGDQIIKKGERYNIDSGGFCECPTGPFSGYQPEAVCVLP